MFGNTIDASVVTQANRGGGQVASNGEEMRNNFMTLLVAQLNNQDPLNPMENNEMTAQLAQINTVSGIESLNDTMQNINGQIDAQRSLQAAGLIGKAVLVPGDRLLVGEAGDTTPFGLELQSPVGEMTAKVYNESGMLVRTFDLGAANSGSHSYTWDGLMDDGTAAPPGSYRFSVEAVNDGKSVSVEQLNYAQVLAVSNYKDGPRLDLGGILDPVRLEDIRQII
ncbi:MAG TPA: flagellar hook assembly protein FlgD [Pseudidiomarina sp.]|nr:flagellar hook assembly protein FlgD [Pseudidiomarina sp.]